jgi:hypothetical protein
VKVEVIREQQGPPPIKEVVLRLDPQELHSIQLALQERITDYPNGTSAAVLRAIKEAIK